MMSETERKYQELLLKLSPREAKFVVEFCNHGNASEAARKAGYSERSAGQIGHETLKKHEIAEAIQAGVTTWKVSDKRLNLLCKFPRPLGQKLLRAAVLYENLSLVL